MFDNFLNNEKNYLEVENFWILVFKEILESNKDIPDNWTIPFYNTTFNNGGKFMDGNPIFSAKSKKTDKSVKIIQEELENKNGNLSFWIDENGKNELVINCQLNYQILMTIKSKITDFIITK